MPDGEDGHHLLLQKMSIGVLAICIATNVAFCLVYYWERCHRKISEAAAVDMTTALDLQTKARAAERTGRIRAEVDALSLNPS